MSQGKNRASWRIGFAYAGILVGAGFSTGQEVLQFFASHGMVSIFELYSLHLYLCLSVTSTKLGFRLNAESHETPLRALFGEKSVWLSTMFSFLLIRNCSRYDCRQRSGI